MLSNRIDHAVFGKQTQMLLFGLRPSSAFLLLLEVKAKVLTMTYSPNIIWPLCCSLNKLDTHQPQALCICCYLCLEYSTPDIYTDHCLIIRSSSKYHHLSVMRSFSWLLYRESPEVPFCPLPSYRGFLGGASGKEPTCQ